jgi:hypothetical protein
MKSNTSFAILLVGHVLLARHSTTMAQGSLAAPGAPAPMMKTLQQIEPRTPISTLPYVIVNSGSYYLTSNLTGVSGTNGITVRASHVTIDLKGFTLSGVNGSADGINVGNDGFPGAISTTNLAVVNGVVQGWGGYGIRAGNAHNGRFEQLHLSANAQAGLDVGNNSVVSRCAAHFNGWYGFNADGQGALFDNCAARTNGVDGFRISSSRAVNCFSSDNQQHGFLAFNESVVKDSTARDNVRSGILAASGAAALNNSCIDNNKDNFGGAAGITAGYGSGRIDGNHIIYPAGVGILVSPGITKVVVIRNTTVGVLANSHSIPAGNDVGPWGQAATATSPWANIRN